MIKTNTLDFSMKEVGQKKNSGDLEIRFKIGTCLPPSCTEDVVREFLLRLLPSFLPAGMSTILQDSVVSCIDQSETKKPYSSGQIIMIVLLVFLALMTVAGTVVDCLDQQGYLGKQNRLDEKKETDRKRSITRKSVNLRQTELESHLSFKSIVSLKKTFKERHWWTKILIAFSLRLNLGFIFMGDRVSRGAIIGRLNRSGTVTCLFGIKVLSMLWVIAGHVYIFAIPYLGNVAEAASTMKQSVLCQLILNASLSVDSFFLLSGFLTAYVWFRRTHRNNGATLFSVIHWLRFFLHRLVRIFPAYIVTLGFVSTLYPLLGDGPNWSLNSLFGAQCQPDDWWQKLLFVSNFFPNACLPWTWYLSVDFQFYLISPLLLILMWKQGPWACTVGIVIILCSSVARGAITVINNYPPNLLLLLPEEHYNRDLGGFFTQIYAMPYMRINAYIVGMFSGWHMAMCGIKGKTLSGHKMFVYCVVSSMLGLWSLFGAYPLFSGIVSPVYSFVLAAVARTGWAISVALLIIVCHQRPHCLLNRVFSWDGWRPFTRITYCAFLVHELVIQGVYQSMKQPLHYNGIVWSVVCVLGFAAVSYLVAIPLNLLAESPPLSAERLIFKRRHRRSAYRTAHIDSRANTFAPEVSRAVRTNVWVANPHNKISQMNAELLEDPTQEDDSLDSTVDCSTEDTQSDLSEISLPLSQTSLSIKSIVYSTNINETSEPLENRNAIAKGLTVTTL